MRLRYFSCIELLAPILVIVVPLCEAASPAAAPKTKFTVFEATLGEPGQKTPELSTDEFKAFLSRKNGVVLDARPNREFAISHVPGSTSIEETGLLRLVQTFPDRSTEIVVYASGPSSDQARHRAEELMDLGYSKVSRYQLGLAIWRALGNAAETTAQGFRRVLAESNAVIIDARSRADYLAGTIPAAENIQAGEVGKALQDRRLRYYDYNTRIIVFGDSASQARAVAEEIAVNAYPNCSFFGGTYQELKRAKFFSERKPSSSNLDGPTR
jgi:rhodanese-related sulfurtransferase